MKPLFIPSFINENPANKNLIFNYYLEREMIGMLLLDLIRIPFFPTDFRFGKKRSDNNWAERMKPLFIPAFNENPVSENPFVTDSQSFGKRKDKDDFIGLSRNPYIIKPFLFGKKDDKDSSHLFGNRKVEDDFAELLRNLYPWNPHPSLSGNSDGKDSPNPGFYLNSFLYDPYSIGKKDIPYKFGLGKKDHKDSPNLGFNQNPLLSDSHLFGKKDIPYKFGLGKKEDKDSSKPGFNQNSLLSDPHLFGKKDDPYSFGPEKKSEDSLYPYQGLEKRSDKDSLYPYHEQGRLGKIADKDSLYLYIRGLGKRYNLDSLYPYRGLGRLGKKSEEDFLYPYRGLGKRSYKDYFYTFRGKRFDNDSPNTYNFGNSFLSNLDLFGKRHDKDSPDPDPYRFGSIWNPFLVHPKPYGKRSKNPYNFGLGKKTTYLTMPWNPNHFGKDWWVKYKKTPENSVSVPDDPYTHG